MTICTRFCDLHQHGAKEVESNDRYNFSQQGSAYATKMSHERMVVRISYIKHLGDHNEDNNFGGEWPLLFNTVPSNHEKATSHYAKFRNSEYSEQPIKPYTKEKTK